MSDNQSNLLYYPSPAFNFKVEFNISGNPFDTCFQEVSGLQVEIETEPFKEGGENRFTHILPVRTKYGNVTLKRGMTPATTELIDWCKKAIERFEFKLADVVITLENDEGKALAIWSLVRAYPVKWTFSNLDAAKSEFMFETLVLSYAYFEFKIP